MGFLVVKTLRITWYSTSSLFITHLVNSCIIKFSCASVLHIPIVHADNVSKQMPRENYRVENVIKQLVHASAVRSSRLKHLGSLESTQEAEVALGYASSNSYASFVLSKLPACFISR